MIARLNGQVTVMCLVNISLVRPGARKYRALYIFLLLGVLFLTCFGCTPITSPQQHLVVETPGDDEHLYTIPVESKAVFEMSYLHSVSNRTVQGSFEITGEGEIKPLTTTFDSFGPGLPELDGSLDYEILDGKFVVYHDEEPRAEISLFVSPLTDDRLYLHGQEYNLASHFDNPTLLRIYTAHK